MNVNRRRLLAASMATLAASRTHGQAFPAKPLKIVVPFAAGGSADAMARILAQGMSMQLGQAVTIENRGGAGGIIGIDAVAKAAPDGYTLGLGNATGMSAAQFMTDKMPFDSERDLALLTLVVRVPEVLVANAKLGFNTTANLVAYAKANPGKLNYGSAGASSIIRLAVELFKIEAGCRHRACALQGHRPGSGGSACRPGATDDCRRAGSAATYSVGSPQAPGHHKCQAHTDAA